MVVDRQIPETTVRGWIGATREVSGGLLLLILLTHIALTSFINLVVFPAGWFDPLSGVTHDLINGTLQAYLLFFLVIGLLWRRQCGLGLGDLALHRSKLLVGLIVLVVAYAFHQITPLLHGQELNVDSSWETAWSWKVGDFFGGQLLGNSLYEEVFFRAFLISQFTIWIRRRWNWGFYKCLISSVILSQLIFALVHVPNRIYRMGSEYNLDVFMADQGMLFGVGILMSIVFLLSNNLFIPIGIHAMANSSPDIFLGTDLNNTIGVVLLISIGIGLGRWWQGRRSGAEENESEMGAESY